MPDSEIIKSESKLKHEKYIDATFCQVNLDEIFQCVDIFTFSVVTVDLSSDFR